MPVHRSKIEDAGRQIIFAIAIVVLLAIAALTLPSCSRQMAASDRYLPSEDFGDGGATRCGTVNTPRQWLKPCK